MNKKLFFLAAIILSAAIVFNSCKKKIEDPAPITGVPTAVGTPVGAANSLSIGASGGTIVSTDGRIEIIIPAGALSAATNISIQPITNMMPQGCGLAYSLTPHGQIFSVPVTIRFHYDSTDLDGSHFNFLEIATQDDDHIWHSYINYTLDSVAKTLSVATKHFSDWADFVKYSIEPLKKTVTINESQTITVTFLEAFETEADEAGDDLAPLTYSIGNIVTCPNPQFVTWILNDAPLGDPESGIINPLSNSSTTVYTAPGTTDNMDNNPVTVKATLNLANGRRGILTSNITVIGKVWDVTVDLASAQVSYLWFTANYTDHAAFTVTLSDDNLVATPTSPLNWDGIMSAIVPMDASCTINLTGGTGNLLDVTSVFSFMQGEFLSLSIFSNRITAPYTVLCPTGDLPVIGNSIPLQYDMPAIKLDGEIRSQSEIFPMGEVVTITVIPQ